MNFKSSAASKKDKKNNELNFALKVFLSIVALTMIYLFIALIIKINHINISLPIIPYISARPGDGNANEIKKFSSEQDFKNYLETSLKMTGGYSTGVMINRLAPAPGMMEKSATDGIGGGSAAPDRVSGTNIQVIGIDEPDIVKTNGREIYFSGSQRFYPMMRGSANGGVSASEQKMIAPSGNIMPPIYQFPERTNVIKAFPPADLALDGVIDKQGDLLLSGNNLIVFSNINYYGSVQEIDSYDVSNPKSPVKKWSMKLDNNTSVIASRLRDGKIYLVTRNNINTPQPCPFKPLSVDGVDLNIRCLDIYHPIQPVPVDSTFIAMEMDPSTGKIGNTVSFVGSSSLSVVYVSDNAIYSTYTYDESIAKFFSGFVKENSDIFPSWLSQKIMKLTGYDITENSKIQEVMALLQQYENSLSSDEKLKMDNEMTNRMSAYYKAHNRDMEKTGIVKIDLGKFEITASGAVPGHLLNNFSMDEYQGNLRVATTIGARWGIFNGIGTGETVSDVTVLDKNLKTIGSVKDLGKTEQIYSVRFIEDKGYVVTFRQTDPFYMLDLANPKNPELAGELKIPGYSSYLHPLDATHILGIGQEGSQVKISLFDVSDKNNPVEMDKYLLDEYWTEVSNNYHAFLLDAKHNIFFLPGNKGGYVFSYLSSACPEGAKCIAAAKYKLDLKKAVSQNSVKRAIYINDYLYIVSDDKITVLNELDWQKVSELDLTK